MIKKIICTLQCIALRDILLYAACVTKTKCFRKYWPTIATKSDRIKTQMTGRNAVRGKTTNKLLLKNINNLADL